MKTYDLIVVGLGSMGSSALYHAARRNLSVLGVEQFDSVPHEMGSHHGSTRIIRKAYFEDPSYVPLLLRAYDLWAQLERDTGNSLLTRCGGLMIGAPDSDAVSGAIRAAREHSLVYDVLSAQDVRKRYPAIVLKGGEQAVFEPDAGYLNSELSVLSFVQQAAAHGAEIRLGTKVGGWTSSVDGVRVQLGSEIVYADQLILTVGAWAPNYVPNVPLDVERQVLTWLAPTVSNMCDMPIYLVEEQDGTQFYGFPEIPGQGVKVALHHGGSSCTADTVDRTVYADDVERVRAALKHRMPSVANGTLLRSAACMYTNTPDQHFVVGPHPEHANVIIGCGYSGHGFKFSSVMGELLVDLARDSGSVAIPPIFDPQRW